MVSGARPPDHGGAAEQPPRGPGHNRECPADLHDQLADPPDHTADYRPGQAENRKQPAEESESRHELRTARMLHAEARARQSATGAARRTEAAKRSAAITVARSSAMIDASRRTLREAAQIRDALERRKLDDPPR